MSRHGRPASSRFGPRRGDGPRRARAAARAAEGSRRSRGSRPARRARAHRAPVSGTCGGAVPGREARSPPPSGPGIVLLTAGVVDLQSTSTIGLAARPGTDVDPMCSMRRASGPSAAAMRRRSASKRVRQRGSYATISTVPGSRPPMSTSSSSSSRWVEECGAVSIGSKGTQIGLPLCSSRSRTSPTPPVRSRSPRSRCAPPALALRRAVALDDPDDRLDARAG